MPKKEATAVQYVPGEEQTSYVSPGQEIEKYYERPKPQPPKPDQKLDNATFISAAILLADHMNIGYDEATTALLVAKTTNPQFDFGILKGMKGTAAAAAESIRKNLPLLQEAFENSIENRLRKIVAALNLVRESFGDKDGWVFPIATLKDHAICLNSKGELFRVQYEEVDGNLYVTKTEKFSTQEVQQESVKKVLGDAVQALMEGKKEKVRLSLRDLIHRVTDAKEDFEKARHQALLDAIKGDSFWRTHIRENNPRIRAFVRGDLKEVYGSGVKPRFHKLRLGEVDQKLEGQYREDVRKSMAAIIEKMERMRDEVLEAFTRDQWRVNSLSAYDKERGLQIGHFLNRFIGDYANTLTTVVDGLRLSCVESSLPFQAHLYDTLAEAFPDYVLGYLFIRKALADIRSGV
jgi:hypothetical protein